MGVPFGDGGEEKFNWASELSIIFQKKPIVILAVGFLLGIAGFLALLTWFKRRSVLTGLAKRLCCKSLSAHSFA